MKHMNQNTFKINLRDLTERPDVHGNREGKEVYQKLYNIVEENPEVKLFEISLDGIEKSDASFPRESVVSIAKQFRGEKVFFLTGVAIDDKDLIDNWHAAAFIKKQPITIWFNGTYKTIGPELSSAMTELLLLILDKEETTTSEIALALNISSPNASSKLKKLANDGYILRVERIASTGGLEYVYQPIK